MIWQRSWVYRLWVVAGLLAVVAVVLYVGLNTQPGDPPPYGVIGVAVGVYLLGILGMQAVDLVRHKPDEEQPLPAGQLPATQEQLMAALTLPGADSARSAAGAAASRRFSIGLFGPTALVAILLPLGGWLYISGTVTGVWQPFGPTGVGIPVAALPGLAVVLLLVVALPFNMRKGRRISDDYLSGLGLRITQTPSIILLPRIGTDGVGAHTVGPTTLEGQRNGRPVVVDTYAGNTAVLVAQPVDDFEVGTHDGRLVVAAGPAWVGEVLAGVPADPRWHKVRVHGSAQGVTANRRGSALDSAWMLDLWLAELLAGAQRGQPGG